MVRPNRSRLRWTNWLLGSLIVLILFGLSITTFYMTENGREFGFSKEPEALFDDADVKVMSLSGIKKEVSGKSPSSKYYKENEGAEKEKREKEEKRRKEIEDQKKPEEGENPLNIPPIDMGPCPDPGACKNSRIAIVSMCDDVGYFQNLLKITSDNMARYAQKHGYCFFLERDVVDKSRPAAWSKLKAVLKFIDSGFFDYVLWMDADALFVNFDKKIEDFGDDSHDLFFTEDFNGIHTGVFLLKSSEWSQALLRRAWLQSQFEQDRLWEQKAIGYLLKKVPGWDDHMKIMPHHPDHHHNELMSYTEGYQPGDFIVHLAGKLAAYGVESAEWLAMQYNAFSRMTLDEQVAFTKGRWVINRPAIPDVIENPFGWFTPVSPKRENYGQWAGEDDTYKKTNGHY